MRPQRSPKTTRQGGGDSHDTKLPSSGVLWQTCSILPGNIVKSPVVALRLYRITARKRRGRYAESAHRILKDKTFKGNGPSTWRAHRRGTISSYQYELKTYVQVLRLQSSVSHAAPSTRHESGGTHALQLADSIRKDACFVKIVAPLMLHAHAGDSSQCHELLRGVRANGARRRGGAARAKAKGIWRPGHTQR